MIKRYEFKKIDEDGNIRMLICPNCGENISTVDIENYSVCPYCNQLLEQNEDLEDFAVDPLVRNWMEHYSNGTVNLRRNNQ